MRLFYALMPSEAMIAALEPVMHGVSGARWQSAAQLHLTLRFVGDVSRRVADELTAALPRPFELPAMDLSGVGFFDKDRRPNALWVKVAPREPLALLHRKCDRVCQSAGLEPEHRAFMPHITVARLSRSAGPIDGWIETNAGFAASALTFARCSVIESFLTEAGSYYEEIASVDVR